MSTHSMAWRSTCLHGLHQMQMSSCTFRRGLAGRCLHTLTAGGDRTRSQRRPDVRQTCSRPLAAHQPPPPAVSRVSGVTPLCSLLPPAAAMVTAATLAAARAGGQRQLHASTVCFGKKKSAEGLVKRITKDDVDISFARSGGAGGQNVNKVNTKVDMRLDLGAANWLPDDMKEALREKEKNRINGEGELVVTSERTRTQGGNLEDALQKLQSFIDKAALDVQPIESDPVKQKKLAKQKKQANENRLQTKKMKSMKKTDRKAGKRVDF